MGYSFSTLSLTTRGFYCQPFDNTEQFILYQLLKHFLCLVSLAINTFMYYYFILFGYIETFS